MSDLNPDDAVKVMSAVLKIEQIIREVFNPDKINLASLGNVVPHVHWHIVPRYLNDSHYPNPIWGAVTHPDYIPAPRLQHLEKELIIKLNGVFA